MTPEERVTKIENFLSTIAENRADHDRDIREPREIQKQDGRELREIQKGMGLAIAKVAEAQIRTSELQQNTEEKLNAMILTVDRLIGDRGAFPS